MFTIKSNTKVCSSHFKPTDFIPGVASGRRILRETAVPSVFVFSKPKKERKAPKVRTPLPQQKNAQSFATLNLPSPDRDATEESGGKDQVEEVDTAIDMQDSDEVETLKVVVQKQAEQIELLKEQCSGLKRKLEEAQSREALQEKKQAGDLSKLQKQCDGLREELLQAKAAAYKAEGDLLVIQQQLEEEKLKNAPFCIDRFKGSSEQMMFYTGLPDYDTFVAVAELADPGSNSQGRKRKLDRENELFLVLVRLRLGLFEQDLADRFAISQPTVSRICCEWVNLIYAKVIKMHIWPSREAVNDTMPASFTEKCKKTRVILDATEIRCAVPSSLALQSSTYSQYKSANTFKGLIGIMPSGQLSFVSELYTGCMSDRECVIQSGFLDLSFDEGDVVMADKGFKIADLLEEKGVSLNIPPFLQNGKLSEQEVRETQEIASLRIHVERRIQRIKAFHIFDRPVPLTLAPVVTQIWTVVAVLTNLQSDLIANPGVV